MRGKRSRRERRVPRRIRPQRVRRREFKHTIDQRVQAHLQAIFMNVLRGGPAAVDVDNLTGDERRLIRGQKQDRVSDLFWTPGAT
jgi:hypothetical protein